ncbi:MAG TPA: hypothetical protein VFZ43_01485 [Anaerolineales bacterium]
MSLDSTAKTPPDYEIRLSGQLREEIAEWFGMNLTVEQTHPGATITILSGRLPDQAALFGVLNRIRDLGLKLISVNPVETHSEINTENGLYQRRNDDHTIEQQT